MESICVCICTTGLSKGIRVFIRVVQFMTLKRRFMGNIIQNKTNTLFKKTFYGFERLCSSINMWTNIMGNAEFDATTYL